MVYSLLYSVFTCFLVFVLLLLVTSKEQYNNEIENLRRGDLREMNNIRANVLFERERANMNKNKLIVRKQLLKLRQLNNELKAKYSYFETNTLPVPYHRLSYPMSFSYEKNSTPGLFLPKGI